ncbi:hypothetical protein J2045_004422 [Peteryoungia aggregata LMG 23059]|uniref:Uncharacterized protein n=1 Tax=Peteryoungia aggregata LMG 23059 TaxID=1368425 RepID=A0ABU0GFG9_9HYPH|nr:hypothetical protein [Peteryoungia aggregata]MDQ0423370.1 hypothetical protein [Peteryoungia aggregata LMG 23059]
MAKSEKPKKSTDWRKRFGAAKDPHVVMLSSPFAGVPSGAMMLISSPGDIARYVAAIPSGETRSIARLRSDLAKRAKADAMCPVTTAIYLRVVAEVALDELEAGKPMDEVVPFWRIIEPKDKLVAKLSCGPERIEHLRALEEG